MDPTADLEQYLRTATVLEVSTLATQTAANPRRYILDGGVAVVGKLADEQPPGMEVVVRHEAAAWVTARVLGWSHLCSATVLRELESIKTGEPVEASVQVIWPSFEWLVPLDRVADEELWQAAIFDVLVLQSDRAGNNWGGVGPGDVPRLKLVDHAYTHGLNGGLNSSFVEARKDQEVPDEHLERVASFVENAGDTELAELLGERAFTAMVDRAQQIVQSGVLLAA